jgi:hypothetical protein
MRKLTSILLGLILSFSATAIGSAAVSSVGDPGRAWSVPNDGQRGEHILGFLDTFPGEAGSDLLPSSGVQRYNDQDPTCSSLADAKCASRDIRYQAIVPYCKDASEVNCTVDMGVIDSTGKKISATFNRYFPTKALNQFAGSPEFKLPSGVAGSLFSIPSAPHDGGDKYYLSVQMNGNGNQSTGINMTDFSVKLYPVALEVDPSIGSRGDTGWNDFAAGVEGNSTGKTTWLRAGPGFSGNNFCVATSGAERQCAQRYAFPADLKFYVVVRSLQLPSGWLHGRLTSPDITITKESAASIIEIQGEPVAVPVVYKMYKYPSMPAELKAEYDVKSGAYKKDPNYVRSALDYVQGGRTSHSEDPLQRNVIVAPEASSSAGMEQLKLWLPFVEDKATALLSYWSARTLSRAEMEGSSSCFIDSRNVTGIVTTNSTQYSGGPPAFNRVKGTLNYQVAAPHFGTTGDVFRGSYDLVMRSDVARCIYGFTKAPINATLSITSNDGVPQVATVVVGERNGWLYLQAKNFEFSSPVITAKLTQKKNQKYTITCMKGTVSKPVTGTAPKCPKGFKKVA